MSHSDNRLSIRGFLSLLFSHFFAHAAIIPPTFSANSIVSPSFQSLDLNRSTLLNATTRCVLPVPEIHPVSLESCQPAFLRFLTSPDAEVIHRYTHFTYPIVIIAEFGCVVSLDKRTVRGEVLLSKRRILEYALQVLLL